MVCCLSHMCHSAHVVLSFHWSEIRVLGEVVVPVLLKGQVSLLDISYFLSILQQIDFDLRWVEAADVADEDVFVPVQPRVATVDLHLGRDWRHIRGINTSSKTTSK